MDEQQHGDAARASIDLTVDVQQVWRALTSDGGLEPWMGRGASIEAEVNGTMQLPDPVGGRPRQGRVEVVEDLQRLEFSWWPEDRPIERSRVSIVLVPVKSGTRVMVTETVPRSIARSIARSMDVALPASRSADGARSVAVPSSQRPMLRAGSGSSRSLATGHLVGSWSWRLALLVLASNPALV